MPDAGGQPVRNAAQEDAEDRADRQIEDMVRRGLLFAVTDPVTGELSYGATPAGLAWFECNEGWPEEPPEDHTPEVKQPKRNPKHRAPRRRFRRSHLLMSAAAALALPSIAFAGQVITGRNVEPPVQRTKVEPTSNRRTEEPKRSEDTAPLEENRRPARTAKPSVPTAPRTTGGNRVTKSSAASERQYVGKHRGQPARESLRDLMALADLPRGELRRVRIIVPGFGSKNPFTVQVDQEIEGGKQGYPEKFERGRG